MASEETVWRIRDWDVSFEKSQGRRHPNHTWFAMSNRMDSDKDTAIKAHENGAAHFGTWVCLLQVASSCRPRGLLVRCNGMPLDVTSLSRVTRIPAPILEEAIPRLIEIGCLEAMNLDAVEALINESKDAAKPAAPLPDELIIVLRKLGVSPAGQDAIHGQLVTAAANFGGLAKLAAGLEKAVEEGLTDLNSATGWLRQTGWGTAARKAKEAEQEPEIRCDND